MAFWVRKEQLLTKTPILNSFHSREEKKMQPKFLILKSSICFQCWRRTKQEQGTRTTPHTSVLTVKDEPTATKVYREGDPVTRRTRTATPFLFHPSYIMYQPHF